jgi:ubiquinone/menaquinone biosynthesis C-methylase UbiE
MSDLNLKQRGWFFLRRRPEPEVMESYQETDVYSSAAFQAHLDRLDNTFVDHVLSLGTTSGLALDVGTGPGQIPIKLALRLPKLEIIGLDLSEAMLIKAQHDAKQSGVADRVHFQIGDAKKLAFPDNHFNLVICNSLLHHVADPVATLNELARVSRSRGAILLRDLRRPSTLAFPFHISWYGRHYRGLMKKLFTDSVRAAYTGEEMQQLMDQSNITGGRVFAMGKSHIGIEKKRGS